MIINLQNLKNKICFIVLILIFFSCSKNNDYKHVIYKESNFVIEEGNVFCNRKEGLWKKYYKNGKIYSLGAYKNNNREGIWGFWDEDGIKRKEGLYINNLKEDLWRTYNSRGELILELNYKNGVSNGDFIMYSYYDNSVIKETGKVVNGEIQSQKVVLRYFRTSTDTIITRKSIIPEISEDW